ncbi:hypothetical protein ISF_09032 [Cordyceps fumosorosea ARSEF 2679]|uniref:Uncharacterized protein n=1 Tax=Cordyceps fumosorosea (strain ARSEF 2679) TaxID=1081104 RepID=A0A162K429_CORFA|nr:hypothetical protein ISF_09032 [Cordyceps fumosorosea ARSEF 2679]OAA53078.1 hypothetical protein ISF_09032 [Cordyceps fumosorosea ARSEF 2679]
MQLLNVLFLAVASSASATPVAAEGASDPQVDGTGVIFYEHIHYRGFSYEIPSTGRCWPLPENLQPKGAKRYPLFCSGPAELAARSTGKLRQCYRPSKQQRPLTVEYHRNTFCFPPVLYAGLQGSVSDLHNLGLGDEVGSVYCALYQDDL